MRILWVATKPPWPPVDGGRLLMWNSLGGLASLGHEVTLVAPALEWVEGTPERRELEARLAERCRPSLVEARLRPPLVDAVGSVLARRPWTLHRHALPAVRRRVAELASKERFDTPFDAVHVEQVQALAAVRDLGGSLPVVLRAQNVESDLWAAQAEGRPAPVAAGFRVQARSLARAEGRAVHTASLTAALTPEDAARLADLAVEEAGKGDDDGIRSRVRVLAAPFEGELPAGEAQLEGNPPLVIFGSAGWRPNRAGAEWFVGRIWPAVHRAHPSARLHVFGGDLGQGGEGIVRHPAPESSRDALAAGSVLVVPLHMASGVRMKILEAWARGVPVLATEVAARGLGATPGRELLLADDLETFEKAVGQLADPEVRQRLIEAGRRRLAEEHAPGRIAEGLVELYGEAGRISR